MRRLIWIELNAHEKTIFMHNFNYQRYKAESAVAVFKRYRPTGILRTSEGFGDYA